MDFSSLGIKGISIDSRKVRAGDLYVCIDGLTVDGHSFAKQAVENGAVAVLARKGGSLTSGLDVPVVYTDDTRLAMAEACKQFFGDPSQNMILIGITGTNGKTSTCSFVESILLALGQSVGSIGTLGVRLNGQTLDMPFATATTPDTVELYQILTHMQKAGASHVVMEVSSHALALHKVAALKFELGLFTNLSQDHLDFHGTMENYRLAKAGLFDISKKGITNFDDETLEFMLDYAKCPMVTYGIKGGDYQADKCILQSDAVSYIIKGQEVTVPIAGKFTIYNTLCAFAAMRELGFEAADIAAALAKMQGVGGRIQAVPHSGGFSVIVDYAHTPDGLENIITSCRDFTKGRIITVFGCGGDRDAAKRPKMGEAAGRLSDYCIITSDNPRNENPVSIINEVIIGVNSTSCEYIRIVDRKEAIESAIKMAQAGDCIIIAGKGHEAYQEFENGRRIDFDDVKVAREALIEEGV